VLFQMIRDSGEPGLPCPRAEGSSTDGRCASPPERGCASEGGHSALNRSWIIGGGEGSGAFGAQNDRPLGRAQPH